MASSADGAEPLSYVAPSPGLFAGWRALYDAYGESVGDSVDDVIARNVWSWIMNGTHGLGAFIALAGDVPIGFTHYRPFPRTLHGNEACYLDDLYVDPGYRGRGVAEQLIRRVCDVARRKGWTEVRWVTGADNVVAQRLYERMASRMGLLTYRIRF